MRKCDISSCEKRAVTRVWRWPLPRIIHYCAFHAREQVAAGRASFITLPNVDGSPEDLARVLEEIEHGDS
jgi:hypothetical protein